MEIHVVTIFPNLFTPYLNESLLKRAQKKQILEFCVHDLRDFSKDRHHKIDDRPYGGGPGMILRVEPIAAALKKISKGKWPLLARERRSRRSNVKGQVSVIAMDPAGKQLTQSVGKRLAHYERLVLIAGRYEGYDARLWNFVDERISIGPYVLAGGELPALVLIDMVTRNIPGVVGDPESLKEETHSTDGYVEYPQYTRPEKLECRMQNAECRTLRVPKVLLSGNHAKIAAWREKKAKN